jgi:hypothetical protein
VPEPISISKSRFPREPAFASEELLSGSGKEYALLIHHGVNDTGLLLGTDAAAAGLGDRTKKGIRIGQGHGDFHGNPFPVCQAADAQAAAIAQAKADATEALKGYYTKGEVDNLLSTNSTGDRAYAKQYTDELFGSFKFAANSDIDALFA